MVYIASIRTDLNSLWLSCDSFFNAIPSPIYVLAII